MRSMRYSKESNGQTQTVIFEVMGSPEFPEIHIDTDFADQLMEIGGWTRTDD